MEFENKHFIIAGVVLFIVGVALGALNVQALSVLVIPLELIGLVLAAYGALSYTTMPKWATVLVAIIAAVTLWLLLFYLWANVVGV